MLLMVAKTGFYECSNCYSVMGLVAHLQQTDYREITSWSVSYSSSKRAQQRENDVLLT